MIDKIIAAILLIVGIVNLLPIVAFFDISKTLKLYGVSITENNLMILMRHRGVLLSLIGIALIVSAFKSDYRILAIALALISKITFIFLTFTAENYTSEIKQVALIDIGAIILLLLAFGLNYLSK